MKKDYYQSNIWSNQQGSSVRNNWRCCPVFLKTALSVDENNSNNAKQDTCYFRDSDSFFI